MKNRSGQYRITEKWWLALIVLFYALYNIPYFPEYGDSTAALWHGALTLVPLWIIVYGGLFKLNRQRKLDHEAISREFSEEGEDTGNVK